VLAYETFVLGAVFASVLHSRNGISRFCLHIILDADGIAVRKSSRSPTRNVLVLVFHPNKFRFLSLRKIFLARLPEKLVTFRFENSEVINHLGAWTQ
jgi:hypothetical protein